LSQQTRSGEPLCRLCLSAGKIEPATVVDHITPIAEGGTHETDNLMPLCKRCHDAIKTPADNARMIRAIPVEIRLLFPCLRSALPATINLVELRFSLAQRLAIATAHQLATAAAEGVAKACRDGAIQSRAVVIVLDDSHLAARLVSCYGASVEEIAHHADEKEQDGPHADWIEAFKSTERARRAVERRGTQVDRAGFVS
jgi:hypothetical protein